MLKSPLCLSLVLLSLSFAGFDAPRAQAQSEDDLKGIYGEPVELRRKEPNDLIDTAGQFLGLFERRSLLHEDPAVLELVRRIGHELAPPPTDYYINYEFYVLRDPSPNAFAFPNGQIYIHTGMLARLADESQLAAILAHEINHVAGHHTILSHRITAKRFLINILGGGLASVMGQLRYSRHLEQEADDRASLLIADTDYDPHAIPEALQILVEDFEGLDPRIATIWLTHPDPEGRVETSRQIVADMPARPRDPAAYEDVIYPLRELTVRDYIQDDYPYTAMAVARRFMELYPDDLDFVMALGDAQRVLGPRPEALPEDYSRSDARRALRQRVFRTREQRAEELLATPEGVANMAANLAAARATYEFILEMDPGYTEAYRGMGEVYEAEGNDREAGRAYLTYLQETPGAEDRPVIMARLTEIRDRLTQQETDDD
ncbi:MAG TPA: M48 family metalloprotease [Gammaproteobacteria bacterium]